MDVSASKLKRSVMVHAGADLEGVNAAPSTSGTSRQGRTSHFTTYYGNGLLNHARGNLIVLTSYPQWGTTVSSVVAGKFGSRPFDDLLFYDATNGVLEFHSTEGGNLSLLRSYSGWPTSWTSVVRCKLGGPYDDLLFYDQAASYGEMYRTDGHGGLTLVQSHTWTNPWAIITPCKLTGGAYDDLLFYDPSSQLGEFHKMDGHGNLSLIASYSDWRPTWSAIARFERQGQPESDLLFYDPTNGDVELYAADRHGGMSLIRQHSGLPNTWSIVKPCRISGNREPDLLVYDPSAGVGGFYTTDENYDLLPLSSDDWGQTVSIIEPANFIDGAGQDLLFYDRVNGTGELDVTRGNTLATALLSSCEADYSALRDYFGQGSDDLPFDVYVQSGHGGGSHGGCDDSELHLDAFDGNSADLVRMLLVSEADEVFEADLGNGWDCGASHGEGLSRVLAAHRYPQSMTYEGYSFRTGGWWIWSPHPRHNWVDENDGTDQNFTSTGCATLFIHYLKFQLRYALEEITQASGQTLGEKFQALTGRTDAYLPFEKAIERRFDRSLKEPFDSDNAFPIYRDLLFYSDDGGDGVGEFYTTDIGCALTLIDGHDTWPSTWSLIAAANFRKRSYNDLLVYDRGGGASGGSGRLYETDGHGQIKLIAAHNGWRTSWDIIIPARFGKQPYDGILFYDRQAGEIELYTTNGHGQLTLLAAHSGLSTTWEAILAASFTRNRYPDLLCYDPQAGQIQLYTTDTHGNLELIQVTPTSTTWSLALACNVTGGEFSDLMLYDRNAQQVEFFTTFGDGSFRSLSGPQQLPGFWPQIHHTAFREFLCYDQKQGRIDFYRVDDHGHVPPTPINRLDGQPTTWSQIVPGTFT